MNNRLPDINNIYKNIYIDNITNDIIIDIINNKNFKWNIMINKIYSDFNS